VVYKADGVWVLGGLLPPGGPFAAVTRGSPPRSVIISHSRPLVYKGTAQGLSGTS
jgi:hypothetical protein